MKLHLCVASAAVAAVLATSMPVFAQEAAEEPESETLIVTGVRGKQRTVADSPVPVDVFGAEDLAKVSFTDTNDVLKTLSPSYTLARNAISDGASFIRPASLRGLPTDKTLVLVNSKRRHRAALVSLGGSGSQGPDIATIPVIALKSVEVLRDGAAAQYGSDAIAGVINFILKDATEGLSMTAQTGQYYAGDGFEYNIAGNIGFALGDSGFVNFSAEYQHADDSNRARQYCDPWFCVPDYAALPGNEDYAEAVEGIDTVQRWGQPTLEAVRTFVNAGYEVSDAVELYGFGNYSRSTSTGGFYYRYPGNGTIEEVRLQDGSIYTPLSRFPGGFTPQFTGQVTDYSAVGGIRGAITESFSYDLSTRFGHDEINYTFVNTINPSLGPDSPTVFKPGSLINEELQFQADFTKTFDAGLAGDIVFAFGGTYSEESYELKAGDLASYQQGPFAVADPFGFCNDDNTPTASGSGIAGLDCANPDDPVYQTVGVGSNGFPGYPPEFTGTYKRNSYGIYGDLSADITDALFVQGALRYEKYSDFSSQLIYKVAGRYKLTDSLALRGSYGTGFRAPTPGQQGTTNVGTRLPNGVPIAVGIFPAASAVSQALGAQPLKPEKSTNYTAGLTFSSGAFNITLDYYRIELQDRLNAISEITIVDDCDAATAGIQTDCLGYRGKLVDAGVSQASSIGGVYYFTNAFDTVTQGVDVVATWSKRWSAGHTSLSVAMNYNTTDFDGEVNSLFNARSQFDFKNNDPKVRGVFTATHSMGPFEVLARLNYFGKYKDAVGGDVISAIQNYGANYYFDLEGSFTLMDNYRLSIGARNLFDNYPELDRIDACCGRKYLDGTTLDWQGGYYYAKISAKF